MKAVVAYLCREEKKREKEGPGAEATKGLGPDRGPGEGGGACPVAMAGQVIGTTVHLLVCGAASESSPQETIPPCVVQSSVAVTAALSLRFPQLGSQLWREGPACACVAASS